MRALLRAASVLPARPTAGAVSSVISLSCAVQAGKDVVKSQDMQFHGVWLRDHCRCPACYNATSRQRQVTPIFGTFAGRSPVDPFSAAASCHSSDRCSLLSVCLCAALWAAGLGPVSVCAWRAGDGVLPRYSFSRPLCSCVSRAPTFFAPASSMCADEHNGDSPGHYAA
jgi:hypothetical protein